MGEILRRVHEHISEKLPWREVGSRQIMQPRHGVDFDAQAAGKNHHGQPHNEIYDDQILGHHRNITE